MDFLSEKIEQGLLHQNRNNEFLEIYIAIEMRRSPCTWSSHKNWFISNCNKKLKVFFFSPFTRWMKKFSSRLKDSLVERALYTHVFHTVHFFLYISLRVFTIQLMAVIRHSIAIVRSARLSAYSKISCDVCIIGFAEIDENCQVGIGKSFLFIRNTMESFSAGICRLFYCRFTKVPVSSSQFSETFSKHSQ